MNSIRGRLTLAYAMALGATLLVFAAVMLTASRNSAQLALQRRVENVAELASRTLQQAGTGLFSSVVVTEDSVPTTALSARVELFLAALPGYVLVADSTRLLYESAPYRQLTSKDRKSTRLNSSHG